MLTFSLKDVVLISILRDSIDAASAWFFCCTIGVFVLPLIIDRIIFYLPRLIQFTKTGEVQSRSVPYTVLELILWIVILFGIYIGFYFWLPSIFILVTSSIPAKFAWALTILNLFYRSFHFDKVVKRNFYYTAYMRYITPDALSEYQRFIEDVDDLYIDELNTLLQKDLPYMHRQAILRKRRQINAASSKKKSPLIPSKKKPE